MRALRYQVNPHLLYNTLNSIAALILDKQNDVAEAMVVRLSDFFRASLSIDPHADVDLVDEVAFQRLYLDIEQMRFPDRLSSEIDIPKDLERAQVPSMILQPIVENALKHGVHPDGSPTHLKISASRAAQGLVLEVADNGPGPSTIAGTGVGLTNVRERLLARFGERAVLQAENRPGAGFTVRLTLPVVMA
jgi:LytS/YehU family sensor histidine kinase